MSTEQILVELLKDYYTLKVAYQKEQESSKQWYGWYKENKVLLDKAEEEIKGLKETDLIIGEEGMI